MLLLPALSGFWTVVIVVQVLLGIAVLVDQHRRGGGARAARIVAVLTMALAGGIGYVDNLVSALQQVQACRSCTSTSCLINSSNRKK